jgi:hypothetical protein
MSLEKKHPPPTTSKSRVTRGSSVEFEGVRVELEGIRVELEGIRVELEGGKGRPGRRQTHIMIHIIIKTKTPPITKNLRERKNLVLFFSAVSGSCSLAPGVGRAVRSGRAGP